MARTSVGVIGCGYWGPKLVRNFRTLPNTELRYVADLREERLGHVRELYPDVQVTTDFRHVLESDVDAVAIATPVCTHRDLAVAALRAGKHVLVEKPLASTAAEAAEIVEIGEAGKRVVMVGHTFLYNPAVNALRAIVQSGELGTICYVDAIRVNLGLLQPDINVIWDLAPHDVSILLHVLGCSPTEVSANGGVYVQRRSRLHELAYVGLRFPNDVIANLRLSWLDPVKTRRVTVVGSRKMVVYDDIADDKVMMFDKGVEVPVYSDTPEQFAASYRHGPETSVGIAWAEPLAVECADFIRAIQEGAQPCSDASLGLKVVQVLEAADRSLHNRGAREVIRYDRLTT
jgi:predicted dehydrogenase